MLNRQLEEFELGELIGSGTAGRIYDAIEKESGKEVALKILPGETGKDRNIYIRFEREMLILSKLNHPNIVEYYGGGKDGDSLFYAMEKVEGGTLAQLIERHGKLTWQETVRYGIRICSALQYMHNYGIIHRDIKPSNIFMTFDGKIKLGDFGIAYDSGENQLTETGLIVGSYAYMSPEQIRGKDQVDSRADLYSLGCILFEMLCGRPPYQGDTFAQIFDQHLSSDVPDVTSYAEDVPKRLEDLIRHLMEKDRDERPFNARAAQGVLSELKIDWEEDELRYKKEMSRLNQAFDSHVATPPGDVSWGKLTAVAGVSGFLIFLGWLLAQFTQ